ncbi:MAG TPA: proline dehydrogenase, partial [Saprospiraceae bacterium]|nr:proline dehydrogenase [Saprospiraceae bacterium]
MIKNLDFNNTEVAFRIKNDRQLGKMRWLYNMMNKPWLVNIGSKLGLAAIKVHLPGAETVLKSTIFDQFCGGETLLDCQPNIEALASMNVLTILDYGAEGKEDETDFNFTMN